MMRQVVQRRTGVPWEVAEVDHVPVPQPGPGEVLIKLVAAPINPAELLMFEGRYGYGETVPPLPRKAGIEGVGEVAGGATDVLPLGTPVALLGVDGLWSDYCVLPAAAALTLPADVDRYQLAMGLVNPQAVLLLLEDHVPLGPGDWIVQNAANSAFGRILDAIAYRRGHRVVNVVRSEKAAASLREARGPVVVDGPDLTERVLDATGGARPRLAVDAVGGAATGRLGHTLEPGGVISNYGLLSGEPCQVDAELIVFHGVRLEGYWTPRSMAARSDEQRAAVFKDAFELLATGAFDVPVEATYSLDDVAEALRHSARGGRAGKILVTP
ncbi:zinc-dependent alcohol dehydrogenase family protein [Cryptosporangium phraense]|uniref:enoyl-[acyl-carrier-protein] reductase n=1 Tax=Cryptosporangium phraense TaxID=2593070 RepID=A0A545AZV9_9ACTN|nr:zinc-dependent alcohol dehydrogenase family protein [Cryptosporangium phraense]TQS46135.1 zinc-dependent alcohol dehydrogenase family protein [Cryptosporangium phraense]